MKVSTSFLSSKNIVRDLSILNITDTDYIHVDIMDGDFVPGKTMPFRELKKIYKYTSKRLDVHLMVSDPIKWVKKLAHLNTEFITFHVEIDKNIEKCIKLIHSYGIKCGLAISPNTDVSKLAPYLHMLDLILVMSVEPGKGGQEFIKDTKKKVNEVHKMLKEYEREIIIEIDGGVNKDTYKICKNVDILVAGSYILNSEDYQETISSLRK